MTNPFPVPAIVRATPSDWAPGLVSGDPVQANDDAQSYVDGVATNSLAPSGTTAKPIGQAMEPEQSRPASASTKAESEAIPPGPVLTTPVPSIQLSTPGILTAGPEQSSQAGGTNASSKPGPEAFPPSDSLLLIFGDALDDVERLRIATTQRLYQLIENKGMADTPEVQRMTEMRDALTVIEHSVELDLRRAMRKHPLGPWAKRTVGIGDKQLARLLAVIGDPAERPNVAKLWAYCGYHVIKGAAPRSRRGVKNNWSSKAKSRTFLIAESCIKHRHSPYRAVYDAAREKYDSPEVSLGHQHARAMRIVSKTILKDLWREARRLQAGQAS